MARAHLQRVLWLVMDVGVGYEMGTGGEDYTDILDSPTPFFSLERKLTQGRTSSGLYGWL